MTQYKNWKIYNLTEKVDKEPSEIIPFTIKDLLDYPYISDILNHKIYCIWIGGSSFLKLYDEYSDYDICLLVDKKFELPKWKILFNNRHAHFLQIPVKNFLNGEIGSTALFTQSYMSVDKIIWQHSDYIDVINKWCNIDFIKNYAIVKVFLLLKEEIEYFLKHHYMPEIWRRRCYVSVIEMYCYLHNINVLEYKSLICTIKRSRWKRELTEEEFNQLYQITESFYNDIKDWDHTAIINKTEQQWKEYWKDLE